MHLTKAGLLVAGFGVLAVAAGHALPLRRAPAIADAEPSARSPRPVALAAESAARPAATASPTAPPITVFVAGDVRRPGVYTLAAGARVVDAYRSAGGAPADADPVAVDLAAPLRDGEEIVVPRRGERPAVPVVVEAPGDAANGDAVSQDDATPAPRHRRHRRKHRRHRRVASSASAAGDDAVAPIDSSPAADVDAPPAVVAINGATAGELEALPGIGPALAGRIVRYRDVNGPFASVAELADVAGMTSGKIDAIAPLVRF